MPDKHIPATPDKGAFHCPHCGVYSRQYDKTLYYEFKGSAKVPSSDVRRCESCAKFTIWMNEEQIYPKAPTAPRPAEDMPAEAKKNFNEARLIVDDSPKAATALLRLSIEEIAQELTGTEKRLNSMIGDLVEKGVIDPRIQRALDSVRVVGNKSVHPGKLDIKDDRDTALRLFDLVNTIVELTITRERIVNETYESLPEDQRKYIEDRDKN